MKRNNFDEDESYNYYTTFEGIIPMIYRWYRDTSSDNLRRWAEEYMEAITCPECLGARLKKESLFFKLYERNIAELSEMSIAELRVWFDDVENHLSEKQIQIGREVLKEIRARIGFLVDVGLEYLALNRPSRSLSGGESQRIRLATQIGSQLVASLTFLTSQASDFTRGTISD